MKKVFMIAMFAILLAGFVFAIEGSSNALNNTNGSEEDKVFCTQEAKLCSDGSYVSRNSSNDCEFNACPGKEDAEDNETESHIVGASCGTVTPGENNECCINKGYSGWSQEKFKCIGEKEDGEENENNVLGTHFEDEKDCEAWNCTKWSVCLNGIETRKCTKTSFNCTEDNEIPKLKKNCSEKERFGFDKKLRDCPEACTCSGSTIKCTFENGTRVMTIYTGESGNVIVQIQNINMSTNVTLYKGEDGKIYGVFNGNITREIKLPDNIKDRLENHTKTKLYNESINLTEDGYYQIKGKKKARLFWLIPVKEHVDAEVNAETGETVKIRNPWWGFLAKDIKENNVSGEGQ